MTATELAVILGAVAVVVAITTWLVLGEGE